MRRPLGINPLGSNRVISFLMLLIIIALILKYIFKIQIP